MPRVPRARSARPALATLLATLLAVASAACPAALDAQSRRDAAAREAASVSAPVSDVRYELTADRAAASHRSLGIAMTMSVGGRDANAPVLLSLPAWAPGAYEIGDFAGGVSDFDADADGRPLRWERADPDTWRVFPAGARRVRVRFRYAADSLDDARSWTRPDFALVNGTNVFPYAEGRPLDFAATVAVHAEPGWRVATGLRAGARPDEYVAASYHDLVDAPFFVGRFDLDSAQLQGRWVRLATYPERSVGGQTREGVYRDVARVLPYEAAVFGEIPWDVYTILQITDSSAEGASGLEHGNSHVDVVEPFLVGTSVASSLYAHEIFHSWNVKRLRPADLWPYRYDRAQPTGWLWVSEGVTDYYADLVSVRGGVVDSAAFFRLVAGKIDEVAAAGPTSLHDASLSTWVHPADGTGYLYYAKGSLAGLMLDVLIRDASDDRRSLDDVMRELYQAAWLKGQGFTPEQWWGAVSRAAGGRLDVADFARRYVDGREPYPWDRVLPLAGLRLVADTAREPRLGVTSAPDPAGARVLALEPGGTAESAGVRPDDVLVSVGDIPVTDATFAARFRMRYAKAVGATLPIRVRRAGAPVLLQGRVRYAEKVSRGIVADGGAGEKALRVRNGLLRGVTEK